jgi:hypothetical protein
MASRRRRARRPGDRTSLPPEQLQELTDELVRDPTAIFGWLSADPREPGNPAPPPEEILGLLDILDDARDLELRLAPPLGLYVRSIGTSTVAVTGLAFAFTGPILGVPVAMVGLGVGVFAGAFAFWDTGRLIQDDVDCGDRLRAVDQATWLLRSLVP